MKMQILYLESLKTQNRINSRHSPRVSSLGFLKDNRQAVVFCRSWSRKKWLDPAFWDLYSKTSLNKAVFYIPPARIFAIANKTIFDLTESSIAPLQLARYCLRKYDDFANMIGFS